MRFSWNGSHLISVFVFVEDLMTYFDWLLSLIFPEPLLWIFWFIRMIFFLSHLLWYSTQRAFSFSFSLKDCDCHIIGGWWSTNKNFIFSQLLQHFNMCVKDNMWLNLFGVCTDGQILLKIESTVKLSKHNYPTSG